MSSVQSEFAVSGVRGTDVFWRVDDRNQRRYRYECIATVSEDGARVTAFHPHAEAHHDRMRAAAAQLREMPWLSQPIKLAQPSSFPGAAQTGSAGLSLFQYLDFLRLWQIGEREIHRTLGVLAAAAPISAPEISGAVRLVLDFNRLDRAADLIAAAMPELLDIAKGGKDDRWQNGGYALRMIGDLHLRLDEPAQALSAYEAAIALGDNAHRRGLAIRAAVAAEDHAAALHHIGQYEDRWSLPDPLQRLRETLVSQNAGELT